MAVYKIGKITSLTINEFMGLAADPKPTTCDPGSIFIEADTGNVYLFDDTTWRLL